MIEAIGESENCSGLRSCGSDAVSSASHGSDARNLSRPGAVMTMGQGTGKAESYAGPEDHSGNTGSCASPRTTAAIVGRNRIQVQNNDGSSSVQTIQWLLLSL